MSEVFDPVAQRDAARVRANEVRFAVASLRRSVRSLPYDDGLRYVADLLESGDSVADSTTVYRLLASINRFGAVRIGEALRMASAGSQDRKVRELSPRQREALADTLRLYVRRAA